MILMISHKEKEKRIELKRIHTKNNQDPEALTSDIIREMLRECKIDPLDISREVVIEGMSNNVFKKVKKKPDFFIESLDPNSNNLLFEIEHLNKTLDRVGDGEGIESGNMIIEGDLNSTEKEIREDIKFLHRVDIDFLPFSLLTPFPGSITLKELEEKNLVITKDWSKYTILTPVIKTCKLSPEKLRKLLIYSYKELKYLNHPEKMILRVIKSRGIMFVLNPIRFLSLVISHLKMKVFHNKIN